MQKAQAAILDQRRASARRPPRPRSESRRSDRRRARYPGAIGAIARRRPRSRRGCGGVSSASGSGRRPIAATDADRARAAPPRRRPRAIRHPPRCNPPRTGEGAAAPEFRATTGARGAPSLGPSARSPPQEVRSTPVSTISLWPVSTNFRACARIADGATERDGPRPAGMTQKVQLWSQPFCTARKARVWPSIAASTGAGALSRRAASAMGATLILCAKAAPRQGAGLFGIAHDMGDFRHVREGLGLDLRRAAGDDDARAGPLALHPADRLSRLPRRFGGDGAGIDDDEIAFAALRGQFADGLRLGQVQPAAEGDDLDRAGFGRRHGHDGPGGSGANISSSRIRENSSSTGPVMMTRSSAARHSMTRSPPGKAMVARRSVRPARTPATKRGAGRRAAGERQPGSALPDLEPHGLARQNLRQRNIGALRKQRIMLQHRPDRGEVVGLDDGHEEDGVRIAHADAGGRRQAEFSQLDPARVGDFAGKRNVAPAEARRTHVDRIGQRPLAPHRQRPGRCRECEAPARRTARRGNERRSGCHCRRRPKASRPGCRSS